MRFQKFWFLVLISVGFLACKNLQNSEFGLSSSPSFAPPPDLELYKTLNQNVFNLAAGSTGNANGECRFNPLTGKIECTPGIGGESVLESSKEKPEIPTPTPNTPLPSKEVKVFADLEGKKWYNEDKTSYYLPLKNNPDLVQHFDNTNKATGWFFNKKKNMLVKPTQLENPETLIQDDWKPSNQDQLYKMTYQGDRNTWKGEQQIYRDDKYQSTGLNYYYGNRILSSNSQPSAQSKGVSKQDTSTQIQDGYGHLYEVDTQKYRQLNPNSHFTKMLGDSKDVLLTTVYPEGLDPSKSVKEQSYSIDKLNQILKPSERARATPPPPGPTNRNTSSSNNNFQNQKIDNNGLRVILVSGIGCGPCQVEKPFARSRGIPVEEYDMSRGNPYGVSSYPTYVWIDASGNVVKRNRNYF